MRAEVCSHCDNYGEDGICSRYGKSIGKIGCCGIYGRKKFNKPFNRKGVVHVIEYREGHPNPLHLGKEGKR